MSIASELYRLFILALPVACIAWTVTHEEIFREPRQYCIDRSQNCDKWWKRKFFYLFTCEYCFSHYIALFVVIITGFYLVYADWRGYFISFFSLVAVANIYMSLFGLLRQNLKSEKMEANIKQEELKEVKDKNGDPGYDSHDD